MSRKRQIKPSAEESVYFLEDLAKDYPDPFSAHVRSLISGWRKRGAALENVRRRISSDAGNRTFDYASELIDWIDDECRAALTQPQPPKP